MTSRCTKHFSLDRIKEKTTRLGRELERLLSDAPGDTRRILRRFAEGNLGRVQAPSIDAMGGRVSRILERLIGAIVSAALVIGGSMLVLSRLGGWLEILGEANDNKAGFSALSLSVSAHFVTTVADADSG